MTHYARVWSGVVSARKSFLPMPLALVGIFLTSTACSHAQNWTIGDLNGTYSFQFSTTHESSWSKTVECHYGNTTVSFTGGGSAISTEVTYGEFTFDGKGGGKATFTDVHGFNQTASNNSVSITCPTAANGQAKINNGTLVLNGAELGSMSGAYTVQSSGAGTLGSGSTELLFQITGSGNTLLIRDTPQGNISMGTGVAVRN